MTTTIYGIRRRTGTVRTFPSRTAAAKFNKDLKSSLNLSYRVGILMSVDGGENWVSA